MIPAQWRVTAFERALRRLRGYSRAAGVAPHLRVGMEGEEAAFFFLRRSGCTVVARRWSGGNLPGDIDLIAWDGPVLCFVEVKTRTARDLTPAETAVDDQKRRVLRRLARAYMRQLPQAERPPARFDVISVYLITGAATECVRFEGAFGWSDFEDPGER